MAASQFSARILSEQTEIEMRKIRTGRFTDAEWDRFVRTAQVLGDLPLYIDDTGGISIAQIAARSRRHEAREADRPDRGRLPAAGRAASRRYENRVQEITEVTKGLKALAKELEVPVWRSPSCRAASTIATTSAPFCRICANPARSNRTPTS